MVRGRFRFPARLIAVSAMFLAILAAALIFVAVRPENDTLMPGQQPVATPDTAPGNTLRADATTGPILVPPPAKSSSGTASGPGQTTIPGSFPGPDNTGYRHAPGYPGHLTDCSRVPIRSNTTYRFCDFPDGLGIGSSSSSPVNVTFVGCRFASSNVSDANVADYGANITFSYPTFEPNTVSASSEPTSVYATPVARTASYQYGIDQRHAGALTVDHADIWGFAEAVQLGYSSQAGPVTISNSWIHNPRDPGGTDPSTDDHTDGILENYGGLSYITFNHNTIIGNGNTQAIALQGSAKYDHITITNNYLSGYGYMVCTGAHTPDTNMVFTGNVWSTEFEPGFGPLYDGISYTTPGLGGVWRGNTIHVAPGTSWMAAANSGLYWWPDDSNPTSSHQIVGHTHDYSGP
jgi:Right handed beta helix region